MLIYLYSKPSAQYRVESRVEYGNMETSRKISERNTSTVPVCNTVVRYVFLIGVKKTVFTISFRQKHEYAAIFFVYCSYDRRMD